MDTLRLFDSALVCRVILGLLVYWYQMNVAPHPTSQEQEYRPFANQHPTTSSPTPQNRETPEVHSETSSHQQTMSLGTDPICIVRLYYPHDNVVDTHLCDECKKSNELSVCHKLLSIWLLLKQVCLRTNERQDYQFVPRTSISRRFENIHGVSSLSVSL